MLLRTSLFASCLLLLGGCQPADGGNDITTFERIGGPQCPSTSATPAHNDSAAPSEDDETLPHCAVLKVSYPKVFTTEGNPAFAKINQFIQQQLLDYANNDGKKPNSLDEMANLFIGDYQKEPNAPSGWELERTVEIAFNSPTLITLLYTEDGNTGGAHPFGGERYFIFDAKTGEQLALSRLLTPDYDSALNIAGEKAFRLSHELADNANLKDEGFTFANNVFTLNNNVGVLKDGLVFNFNEYEVAPYAMGPSEFTIPYEDIRGLIPPHGLLAEALR